MNIWRWLINFSYWRTTLLLKILLSFVLDVHSFTIALLFTLHIQLFCKVKLPFLNCEMVGEANPKSTLALWDYYKGYL